jgi:hypothetical protein
LDRFDPVRQRATPHGQNHGRRQCEFSRHPETFP